MSITQGEEIIMKAKNIAATMLAASLLSLSVSAPQVMAQTTTKPSQTQQQKETQQSTSPAAPKAKQDSDAGKDKDGVKLQNKQVTKELVEKYSPYVVQDGNQFRFDPPENLKSENAQEVSQVQEIVDTTNESITSGKTEVVGQDGKTQTLETEPGVLEASGSHGGFEYKWWGVQFWLDNWATNRLVSILGAGATGSAVAAEFTAWTGIGGLSGGAIAAILGLGAAGAQLCNWKDNGITLNAPYTGAAWCWPR
jgi:hypothetical protein